MRKMLVLAGLIGLVAVFLAGGSRSVASGNGVWANPNSSSVCQHSGLPAGSICVDWIQLGNEEDGTVCCVQGEKISDNSFDDCLQVISRRVRPGETMD